MSNPLNEEITSLQKENLETQKSNIQMEICQLEEKRREHEKKVNDLVVELEYEYNTNN